MGSRRTGIRGALSDLVGAAMPLSLRDLQSEIDDRMAKIPTELNEFGYDAFAMSPAAARTALLNAAILYRYYFRVETFGIEQLPASGMLLIANHAGQLPFDAAMLGASLFLDAEPPRIARGMGEYWIPSLPFVSVIAARSGHQVGTPENCTQLLEAGECVMVFPEGVRGMNKLFKERYRLQRFGLGFMRLALASGVPIVPVGIVGSEEQQPGLFNLAPLARLLGMPALPITPTFPLLGPLGLLPLPVRYRFHFGAPMYFDGDAAEEDAVIQARVDEVRQALDALLLRGREQRSGIFS